MSNIHFHRIPSQPLIQKQHLSKEKGKVPNKQSFLHHLQRATNQESHLKISKHASERLAERNIQMTDSEWQHMSAKVNEAKAKGIKQSLVLTEQAAFIVSAENHTVITAMGRAEAKDQLFTNINGTIILN